MQFLLAGAFLAAPAVALPSNGGDTVALIVSYDMPIAGLGSSVVTATFDDVGAGVDGGWWQLANTLDFGQGANAGVIIGQRPGDTAPSVLRAPQSLNGISQSFLLRPSMANGQLAYVDADDRTFDANQSLWIEDTLIASEGTQVAPLMSFQWLSFEGLGLGTSGQLTVTGKIQSVAQTSDVRDVVATFPSADLLLQSGDAVPGLLGPLLSIQPEVETSPDGAHYSVIVTDSVGFDRAIVIDGEVARLTGNGFAREGALLPQELVLPGQSLVWQSFSGPAKLNDRGDFSFSGLAVPAGGTRVERIEVRNGRRVFLIANGEELVGTDTSGARLVRAVEGDRLVKIEGATVIEGDPGVDVNGDGLADDGFALDLQPSISVRTSATTPEVFLFTRLLRPDGTRAEAVLKGRDFRLSANVCESFVNSTGKTGRMIATGSSAITDNEVSLRIFQLPANVSGFVIVSRSFGVVNLPGGSFGKLCLSGSIGRMVDQVYQSGIDGYASVTLDLNDIPQPLGSVAAVAGETWYAQSWHRDQFIATPVSNFTDAVELTFD